MKKIVVYQSGTGLTEQYARWIAERIECEAKSIKEVRLEELESYDMVVYGGWLMADNIAGLSKIKNLKLRSLVVFAVGMSPNKPSVLDKIKEVNKLGDCPFFYMQGGLRPEKLGFFQKLALSMVRKSFEKKEEKTEEDLQAIKLLKEGGDLTSQDSVEEIVMYCLD